MTKNKISELVKDIKEQYLDTEVKDRPLKELISWGNSKLGKDISGAYIANFSMTSAHECPSDFRNMCSISKKCYAKKLEIRWPNVRRYIKEQALYWKHRTSEEFANEFIACITSEHRVIKALRFNVHGDLKEVGDLLSINAIAEKLKKIKIVVYLYTKRKDLLMLNPSWKDTEQSSNLVINGSEFMYDNNFTIVNSTEDYIFDKVHKICQGDCSVCNLCMKKNNYIIQVLKH